MDEVEVQVHPDEDEMASVSNTLLEIAHLSGSFLHETKLDAPSLHALTKMVISLSASADTLGWVDGTYDRSPLDRAIEYLEQIHPLPQEIEARMPEWKALAASMRHEEE